MKSRSQGRARGEEGEAVEAKLLSAIRKAGKAGASLGTILAETQIARATVNYRLRAMRSAGSVKVIGNRRGARWLVA